MKNTKQKEVILEAVFTLQNHPTADEIYGSLKKYYERLSLGTVYRNLNSFAEMGKIRKIAVPGYGDRFDFRTDEHEHMFCEKCGRVYDINASVNIQSLLPEGCKAQISGYKLMLYGVCEGCAE